MALRGTDIVDGIVAELAKEQATPPAEAYVAAVRDAALDEATAMFLETETIHRSDGHMSYPSEWTETRLVWPDGERIAAAIQALKAKRRG